MRPRELVIEGFRSYAGRAAFDFADRTLVGVVGPIGSGKSSLLDAIAFALYAVTPSEGKAVKSLINQRRDRAHVQLDFDVDGQLYRVVRALRRGGSQPGHVLYRVDDVGETEELASKASDVTKAVVDLVGLDFAAFQRAVLLAQGQFAQFLHSGGAGRNRVLKSVFRLDTLDAMRSAANARKTEAEGKLSGLADLRRSRAEQQARLAETLTGIEVEAVALRALEQVAADITDLDRRMIEAMARRDEMTGRVDALTKTADQLPSAGAANELLERAAVVADRANKASEVRQVAMKTLAEARSSRQEAMAAVGGPDALADLAGTVGRFVEQRARIEEARRSAQRAGEELSVGEARLADTEAQLADAERGRAAAVEAALETEARRDAALEALHTARHAEMAAALRSGLVRDEPCPVCLQEVRTLPDAGPAPALAEAESVSESADRAARAAVRALTEREKAHSSLASSAEQQRQSLERLSYARTEAAAAVSMGEQMLAELLAELEGPLGRDDPAARLAELRVVDGELLAAVAAAEKDAADADAALAASRSETEQVQQELGRLAQAVARVTSALGDEVEVAANPEAIEPALRKARDRWTIEMSTATEVREAAIAEIDSVTAARVTRLEAAGLAGDVDVAAALATARSSVDTLRGRADELEQNLASLAGLEAREKELVETFDLYSRIAADLTDSRFPGYLLGERRQLLSELGSVHFMRLTDDRYRFTDDGEFAVVDVKAAESVRDAKSLSGGETFLASLALALALAETATREGGRLDAFFLDEGFGSLDPEHLELAMDGIERLVAGSTDRLVLVVSHVPELRERIEDIIELDKDAVGHTIVRRGAA